jgi:hypothetical protein
VGTYDLVRPDQKEATIQLMTQASQINDSKPVGHVTSQPLNTAWIISRGAPSMFKTLRLVDWGCHRPRRETDTLDVSPTTPAPSSGRASIPAGSGQFGEPVCEHFLAVVPCKAARNALN